jgi:ABC-type bacteriocin/lantibiotic exporter with double-glycine peptidase domain
MRQRTLVIDAAIAAALAALLLIFASGIAVVAIIAIAVLVVCGLSLVFERLARAWTARRHRRSSPFA